MIFTNQPICGVHPSLHHNFHRKIWNPNLYWNAYRYINSKLSLSVYKILGSESIKNQLKPFILEKLFTFQISILYNLYIQISHISLYNIYISMYIYIYIHIYILYIYTYI